MSNNVIFFLMSDIFGVIFVFYIGMTQFVKTALALLKIDRISDAITYIRRRLVADRNSAGLDNINQIDRNYSFLLKYLADGNADPGREKTISEIREQLYTLLRAIEYEQDLKESPNLYFAQARTARYSGLNFPEALGRFLSDDTAMQLEGNSAFEPFGNQELADSKSRALRDVFISVWTLEVGNTDILGDIAGVAVNADMCDELRAVIVSALTLNLLYIYDRRKLITLLDIYNRTDSDNLKARTLMGILITLWHYSERLRNDYEISLRFDAFADDDTFPHKIEKTFLSLVKARGGLNLTRKIENDILPDIMKAGAGFMDAVKDKDGKINLEKIEGNPQWEKMMNNKVGKKLRKLNDLQSSGGDIMLSMFSQLQDKFHYFNDIDIWFRPFVKWEAMKLGLPASAAELWCDISGLGAMCDLDKYAFALNMAGLSEAARSLITQSLDAQKTQMMEEMKSLELATTMPEFDAEAWNYARVLFRFYNYFRFRKEFFNPFSERIDIFNVPFIGKYFDRMEISEELAEFYFQQEFYNDAIESLEYLRDSDPLNIAVYEQKIAFCYEKLGDYTRALEHYSISFGLNTDDLWTARKLYQAAIKADNHIKAESALNTLLAKEPDNESYLIDAVKVSIQALEVGNRSRIKNADKILSKLDYNNPNNAEIRKIAANYAIASGDFEKALEYYSGRMDDIAMYLAGASLMDNHGAEDENMNLDDDVSNESAKEEEEIANELIEIAAIQIGMGNIREGIQSISNIFSLKRAALKRTEVSKKIIARWQRIPALQEEMSKIQLYIDASLLSM